MLDRVAGHRVVHASDEPGDAHDSLQVDLHDVERRRVIAMRLGKLQRELIGEGGLARVAWAEQRDVGLPLERGATWLANASIPMILDGSSSGRSQMNGFSAIGRLYRLPGT